MPNLMYQKGVRKERKIVNEAKVLGHVAFRSAGSKSPIDVCDINHKDKIIRLIQSKSDKMPQSQITKLQQSLQYLEGTYKVEVVVL